MDIPSSRKPASFSTKQLGDQAEGEALQYLQRQGMELVQRNYRTPGRGGGEIDLIMQDADGTLVFVEVRSRTADGHGGAAASISGVKQRRIIFAARHFLMHVRVQPPCRFDVVILEQSGLLWLKAAFDAG